MQRILMELKVEQLAMKEKKHKQNTMRKKRTHDKRGKTKEGEVSDDRQGKNTETIKTTMSEDTISSNDCHDGGHEHEENGK